MAGEAVGILKFSKEYSLDLVSVCRTFLLDHENKKSNWEKLLNYFIANHPTGIHKTINDKWIEVDTKQDFEKPKEIFS